MPTTKKVFTPAAGKEFISFQTWSESLSTEEKVLFDAALVAQENLTSAHIETNGYTLNGNDTITWNEEINHPKPDPVYSNFFVRYLTETGTTFEHLVIR
jgi:hypothetical protein